MSPLAAYHRAARERRDRRIKISTLLRRLTDLKPGEAALIQSPRPIEHILAEAQRLTPRVVLRASSKSVKGPVVAKTYIVERVA